MPARADDHLVSDDVVRRSILATDLDVIRRCEWNTMPYPMKFLS